MRNKRMFSLDVIDTDTFLDMPVTSQALYFHLGMRADDDGFVSSPKKIMKTSGCNIDDLQVLISKHFIIPFESGVVVITDWKTNNYLRPDRYNETRCVSEKKMLTVNNGKYELVADGTPSGIPKVDQCVTQKRIETEENKYIVEQSPTSYSIQEVIEYLNQRTGKRFKVKSKANQKYIKARFSDGFTLEDFKKVIDLKCEEWSGTQMEVYLRPETLFGNKFDSYLNACPTGRHQLPKPDEKEESIDYSQMDRRW